MEKVNFLIDQTKLKELKKILIAFKKLEGKLDKCFILIYQKIIYKNSLNYE